MTEQYCYRYPHAALTVDCAIFGFDTQNLKILLIERGIEPYKGKWALPGGFMKMDETVEEAARRELFEETGLRDIFMEQFKVFSRVDRDPRERVVTVVFIALVRPEDYQLTAGDDASNALWFDADRLPPMAFDHADIIIEAREHLASLIRVKPIAFWLLNNNFTMSELQRVYETINRTHYDRRNFQRKALQSGLIKEVNPADTDGIITKHNSNMLSECSPRGMCCNDEFDRDESKLRPSAGRPNSKVFTITSKIRKMFSDIQSNSTDNNDDDDETSTRNLFDF